MKHLILLYFCYLLLSCHTDYAVSNNIKEITGYDKIAIAKGEKLLLDSFYIVQLESKPKSFVGNVKKIDFIDNLAIVQSGNNLLAFNKKTGKFKCKYSNWGNAPSEYQNITSFFIDKKEKKICIIDEVKSRMIVFDTNGKFCHYQQFPETFFHLVQNISKIDGSRHFISKYILEDKNIIYSILDFKNVKEVPIYKLPLRTKGTCEFIGKNPYTFKDGAINCVLPFSEFVYTLNNRNLTPQFIIATKKPLVKKSQQGKIHDFNIGSYIQFMDKDYFVGFTDIFETATFMLLGFSNLQYFMVNKNTLHGISLNLQDGKNKVSGIPFVGIVGTDNDYLVGITEVSEILNWKSNNKKIRSNIANLDKQGNHCLLYYKLKEKERRY